MPHNALEQAETTYQFIDACSQRVIQSSHVDIRIERLQKLLGRLNINDWEPPKRWVNSEGNLLSHWLDLAFFAAQAGGFYYKDNNGHVKQWQSKGSGSLAMINWLESLSLHGIRPGTAFNPENLIVWDRLSTMIPYKENRKAIFDEFNSSEAPGKLAYILNRAPYNLSSAKLLAKFFPYSFGEDPFYKKAILALDFLVMASCTRGHTVISDLPIPADYQIPRILSWAGIIILSLRTEGRLINLSCNEEDLTDPREDWIMDYRAASVVACRELAIMAKVEDWKIDQALFSIRGEPEFLQESLPAMRIDRSWF